VFFSKKSASFVLHIDKRWTKCIIKMLDLQQKRVSIVFAVRQGGARILSSA
jgi:hypothetical protein